MTRTRALLIISLSLGFASPLAAQAKLNDLEMAHVAITADVIDIEYAKLVMVHSKNPIIREFAETMIRDHTAVSGQVVALAKRLHVEAKDNAFSQTLIANSLPIKARLRTLRGAALDKFYAQNELSYHRAVNGAVAETFIPNIQNPDVKQAFEGALVIFRGHEKHAEMMVSTIVK